MSIRRRGTGWQVRVKPFPDVTVPTKSAATRIELDLKLRKKLGQLYQEKATTFGDELYARLERKQAMGGRRGKLRESTVAFYRQSVEPWRPLFDIEIPNLRRARVEDHIAARAAVAPVAAKNELQFAKAALRDAQSRGQQVDAGIFAIEAIHHQAAEGKALELDQLDAIAVGLPERVKRIVPLVGILGLRFQEAVQLDDAMLDLDEARITIPSWLNKSRREKPIPLAAVEVRLLKEQRLVRPPGTTLLFPTEKGTVYSKSGFRSVWLPALLNAKLAHKEKNARKQTVIVADFKFHWLRHTAISLMARAGMKAELIAERVGHTDGGALIYRRYRHLFPSELQAAVELVDQLVAQTRMVSGGQEVVDAR